MSNWILDASALLAVINGEPGETVVLDALSEGACISALNLSEVVSKLIDSDLDDGAIRAAVAGTEVRVIDYGEEDAFSAGFLRQITRHQGLSLGDRACLALAAQRGLPVLTANRPWTNLRIGVDLKLIR